MQMRSGASVDTTIRLRPVVTVAPPPPPLLLLRLARLPLLALALACCATAAAALSTLQLYTVYDPSSPYQTVGEYVGPATLPGPVSNSTTAAAGNGTEPLRCDPDPLGGSAFTVLAGDQANATHTHCTGVNCTISCVSTQIVSDGRAGLADVVRYKVLADKLLNVSEVQLLRPLSPIAATASRLFFVHRYTDANCTTSQFHDLVYIYDKCGKLRDGVFAKTVFEGIGPGGKTTTQFYQAPTCTGTSFGFYTYVGRPADEKGSPVQPGIGNTPTGAGSGPAASGTGPVGSAGMPSGLDNTVSVCVQSGSINIRTSISFVLALAEDPAPSPSPSPTPIPAAARQRNTAMRTTAPWHLACIAAILVLYF